MKDRDTQGHSQRVTRLTLRLGREIWSSEEDLLHLKWGALLHDIGKMGIPDSILLKPDKLTGEEWETMKLHPVYAYEMLSPIKYLHNSMDIACYHHEKWDGTGYPCGLKGEEIPLPARLFAIADVWDAMRTDRPYRRAWPAQAVTDHIKGLSGKHFDPELVALFLEKAGFAEEPVLV